MAAFEHTQSARETLKDLYDGEGENPDAIYAGNTSSSELPYRLCSALHV